MRFTPALCALLLAGCFPTRTTELACQVDQECEEGSTCQTGYCLPVQDVAGPDAAPQPDSQPAEPGCADEWPDRPAIFDPCAFEKSGPITVGPTATFDTTAGTWTGGPTETGRLENVQGQQVRVLIVESFNFASGTLRVTGNYPLLIVSWGDVTIGGVVDASSTNVTTATQKLGAGANSTLCAAATPGITNGNGGSGGGGGGFGGAGGRGGDGGNEDVAIGQAGGGALATPPMLSGGCPGAAGGKRANDRTENPGGAGGGAVYFASKTRVTVSGTIDVGGAGGTGAKDNNNQDRGGGSGGGSGGMIGLEAPNVSVTGTLAANGGGGGAGCDGDNGPDGVDASTTLAAANGGIGDEGSDGGKGGFATTAATQAQDFDGGEGGGGGGGGGVGFIIVKAATRNVGGTVTPTAR